MRLFSFTAMPKPSLVGGIQSSVNPPPKTAELKSAEVPLKSLPAGATPLSPKSRMGQRQVLKPIDIMLSIKGD